MLRLSPIASMNISQVLITIIVILISYHLVWLALEAHALIAPTARHSITAIQSHDRHFA